MGKFKGAFLWEVLWLQNTLLKEWNIEPDVIAGICTEFSEALLKPLFIQADKRVAFFDSLLIARLTSGS